jgi:hypothetical protein
MAIAQHISLRLVDGRPLATGQVQRRVLARVVLDKLRAAALLAFGLADNHLHLLLACARAPAAQLAKIVELSLGRRLDLAVRFSAAHLVPVEDQRHLDRAFRYVLRQPERHGLEGDRLREATNLPDLLGLRPLGGFTAANVRRYLPRIARNELLGLLGVPELEPTDGPVEWAVDATLAATALPALSGSSREVLAARRAALAVMAPRASSMQVAVSLGVCDRTLRRMRRSEPDATLVAAIRRQLGLRTMLPLAPTPVFDEPSRFAPTDVALGGRSSQVARVGKGAAA